MRFPGPSVFARVSVILLKEFLAHCQSFTSIAVVSADKFVHSGMGSPLHCGLK